MMSKESDLENHIEPNEVLPTDGLKEKLTMLFR